MATKEWVVIATDRSRRPEEFVAPPGPSSLLPERSIDCPFCPGNEEAELEIERDPCEGPWQLRVVRNRFPALTDDGQLVRIFDGVCRRISGVGAHEVLVESPRHNVSPALEQGSDLLRMLGAFQRRGRFHASDHRIEHIIYFKNHGLRGGSSLVHPHTQLIGLPVVPYHVRSRNEEARRHFDDTGDCVLCSMRRHEAEDRQRVVLESDFFTAFVPFAAFSPFHLWIIPRTHRASFLEAAAEEIRDLGFLMRELLGKIHYGLGDPDYNYVIRSAPVREAGGEFLHWYAVIVPRVSRQAGFELGTGMFINPALPEESASFLRRASADPPA
jgi:UDPglucose--hexose-1-phosphate uridylyltransferase